MVRKHKTDDVLEGLLEMASSKVLKDLVLYLVTEWPDVRRECFDFLKAHTSLTDELKKRSERDVIFNLWAELELDLKELDDYGGGDYDTIDHVGELLNEIRKQLETKKVDSDCRRELLDLVLPYCESNNSGVGDALDDVAHAACYDDSDLLRLAESFEAMKDDWKISLARGIYRDLGHRDKYLELRERKMVYGGDYHDLAIFYWESGEKEKALEVAEKGLKNGQGRMDELREFLSDRAKESGNREKYLDLQFKQMIDRLTLDKYKAFREICTAEEWPLFEPKIMMQLKNTLSSIERLKIRMHRKEYDQAIAILTKVRYEDYEWSDSYELQTAQKLEKRYPEEILKYYLSGLGNLNTNSSRKVYARKAKVMVKVQHQLVEVIGDKKRWIVFAVKVKQDNIRRPAFQEEFAEIVPGWQELK